jgi:hypothetical protein
MKKALIPLLFCLALPCWAGQTEAEIAVSNLLFDEGMENASFKVRSDGFVDILFGSAVSDADYSRLLEKLRAHPDIKGVLAGKSTRNYCPIR